MDVLVSNLKKKENKEFVYFITVLAFFFEVDPREYTFIFDETEKHVPKSSIKNYLIKLYFTISIKSISYVIIPLAGYYFMSSRL
ncbi:MAG: hypothetical protein CMB64_04870 [Euryarchaeota archaeon]|nr:hypothetical protein [Euryarchaeota archaeon]